jgi:integrase
MASLYARHDRTCALFEFKRYDEPLDGCDCKRGPTYVVVVAEGRKRRKLTVGKNRKQAERALRKIDVELDEGSYRPQLNIRFAEWGQTWLKNLDRPRASTTEGYGSTIDYATKAFGNKQVRQLTPSDAKAMLALMPKLAARTKAKHLRVLSNCLKSAVQHGYAARNPVTELPDSERPRDSELGEREPAYFTNEELPRLFAEFDEGVYRVLFLLALKTGMRLGELTALTWGDVDLSEGLIHVRRAARDGRLSQTKNRRRREVLISDEVVTLLGEWWGECGSPAESNVLVLPGEREDGYLSGSTVLRRELYPAMKQAGIPREGPTGEERNFHSFRHTFSKRAMESGAQLTWLSRHLGHSSTSVTDRVYGHYEREERAKQAKLLEGAFGV